jgi:hypothetical protein
MNYRQSQLASASVRPSVQQANSLPSVTLTEANVCIWRHFRYLERLADTARWEDLLEATTDRRYTQQLNSCGAGTALVPSGSRYLHCPTRRLAASLSYLSTCARKAYKGVEVELRPS